jgi:hypothetical protein
MPPDPNCAPAFECPPLPLAFAPPLPLAGAALLPPEPVLAESSSPPLLLPQPSAISPDAAAIESIDRVRIENVTLSTHGRDSARFRAQQAQMRIDSHEDNTFSVPR